jgi:hypothetical protein
MNNTSVGRVIPLSLYQDCEERLLMCGYCQDVWIDFIPETMALHLLECETCGVRGRIKGTVPNRLRE